VLSLVASVARNRAIGRGGALVWDEPLDKQHFKRVTMGCPVIMGRKTWDSLPSRFRPLPGRRNIVVTRNPAWRAQGAEAAPSLDAALVLAGPAEKVCVIGGGELYAQALPRADELLLTEVDADMEGDAFFPPWRSQFSETSRQTHHTSAGTRFDFVTYRRTA
jgi:dihydrofolate reductase